MKTPQKNLLWMRTAESVIISPKWKQSSFRWWVGKLVPPYNGLLFINKRKLVQHECISNALYQVYEAKFKDSYYVSSVIWQSGTGNPMKTPLMNGFHVVQREQIDYKGTDGKF
jgi:hypothetical protein